MSLFKVSCPVNLLWHPTVHHSLLLLRALKQPHTLILREISSSRSDPLPFPLLSQQTMHINISCTLEKEPPLENKARCFYQPEHLLSFFFTSTEFQKAKEVKELREKVQAELSAYLDTAVVASHILNTIDAVLVALSTNEMETTRQLHTVVMELMEQLEGTINEDGENNNNTDNDNKNATKCAETPEEPLSTWPLYSALQFLIEQGGFLTSAFPQIHHAYDQLTQENPSVQQHRRFLERTIRESCISGVDQSLEDGLAENYPQKGFLIEAQRRLSAYTTSISEKMEMEATAGGNTGSLQSRVKGGRLGIQAVPARLPWTLQRTKLPQK